MVERQHKEKGMQLVEAVFADLIGRPILFLVKWLRWPLLFWGFYFNSIQTYDPATKQVVSSEFTLLPFVVGLVLFCIGLRVKRYDEAQRLMMKLLEKLDDRGITGILTDKQRPGGIA